jgi:hypothetical protein
MGYITVKTKTATAWIAGTDALAGGASGNVASTTNYYSSSLSALALTLSRGSTDKNIANTAFTFWLGGDTTPAINSYSLWDLKWRPSCADPRGMALVAGRFWADIYLCGVDHYANGTSRYNVQIADGASPPKVPIALDGNGTTTYTTFTWYEAFAVLQSAGKRLLTYGEFTLAAAGTTEAVSRGSDPASTILVAAYTSKWGVMLASGNMWVWGDESLSGIAVLFGGAWGAGAASGSRASSWYNAPSYSSTNIGARGRCDHLHHV